MKKRVFPFILASCYCSFSMANNPYFQQLLEQDEPGTLASRNDFVHKTRDALFSYEIVEQKANEFADKIRRFTFGEYADHILYAAPFLTGKVEFNVNDIRVYINANQSKTGFEYKLRF